MLALLPYIIAFIYSRASFVCPFGLLLRLCDSYSLHRLFCMVFSVSVNIICQENRLNRSRVAWEWVSVLDPVIISNNKLVKTKKKEDTSKYIKAGYEIFHRKIIHERHFPIEPISVSFHNSLCLFDSTKFLAPIVHWIYFLKKSIKFICVNKAQSNLNNWFTRGCYFIFYVPIGYYTLID